MKLGVTYERVLERTSSLSANPYFDVLVNSVAVLVWREQDRYHDRTPSILEIVTLTEEDGKHKATNRYRSC